MARLRAGYARVANPYGGGLHEVSLAPGAVGGFVLWTRNLRPLMADLDAVRLVAPFIVQFTVTLLSAGARKSTTGSRRRYAANPSSSGRGWARLAASTPSVSPMSPSARPNLERGAARTSGNRPGCRCALSRDIGAYDTCPHGCVYCYAVADRDRAVANFRGHDPEAAMLRG